ncbi:MAG TPA: aminoacyl-histidine dipeptidase [Paludibacteraceae bacterium]|nr:aminoacyl-histidine dipeptidase [Paludibacteraceae bacterium]HQB68499.1 aminoacyl-histidine dipeptidase [Paludibacteraceae bacterium]HRS67000.1 aminoacyl-histidine dipeptidase [Paludibacteraceae bacterium]
MTLKELQPQALWHYFSEICTIPRPSKKEEKVIAYLQNFAKEHNLKSVIDKAGNVVIRKPATPGYENRPKVILQAHMDMVCEKNSGTVHNFDTDPIQPYIDGEWVKARGTTLGADNGIGIAAQLAVLSANNLKHGPLECLFTVDEETGLTGAFALDKNLLTGSVLINLDSEDDGEIFIGCAGGIDTTASFEYKPETAPDNLFYFTVSVKGLTGGHSGDDIDKGRANANKLLTRFLWQTAQETQLTLASFDGGNLRNAIAREAVAVAAVPSSYKETLRVRLNLFITDVEAEFAATEKQIKIDLESVSKPATVIDDATAKRLLYALYASPHGILRMSDDMPGLVETSTNLASVKMLENNRILVSTSQRSSVESAKYDAARMVESVFVLAGATVTHGDGYPGWKPNPNSKLAKLTAETYEKLFSEKAKVRAIHAGLECGLFLEKYPHLDMVSIGPTMRGVHSPDERLHIAHTEKFWKLLVALLESL